VKEVKRQVREALLANPAISAAVDDRVYLAWPPAKPTYPLITYRQVGGSEDLADGGPFAVRPRIEVKVWADSGLEELGEAVKQAVRGVRGVVRLVSEVDLFDYESLKRVKALDFSILARA